MGDTKTTLTWLLRDQVSGPAKAINSALDKTADKAKGSGGLMAKLGAATGGLVNPFSLAVGGATALFAGLGEAAKAAAEEQKNIEKMKTALVAAVPGFDGNTDAIEALISKREDLAFSDDELRASLATLVTSTHDVSAAQDLQATAMDLARLKGVDLATASEALAKANAGSTKELKALGITVDDAKDKTQVFAAIQKAAAGQAEAYASTSAGKWEILQTKIGDLVETVGSALLPIFNAVVDFVINDIVPAIQSVIGWIGDFVAGIKEAVATLQKLLGMVSDARERNRGHDPIGDFLFPQKAAGGPVSEGGAYVVGERGPELFVPNSSGTIIPNGGGGGSPVEIALKLDGRTIAKVVDENLYYVLRHAAPSVLSG